MRASSFTRILFLCSSLLLVSLASSQTPAPTPAPIPAQKAAPNSPAKAAPSANAPIPSPISRHYPILILARGNDPIWSLRLGMKGPERLDRAGYPPIVLDPAEIAPDEPGISWYSRGKDTVTGADVAVKLSRESCSDSTPDIKYTFKVVVQHTQIGLLNGCGQSAPEKFPEFRKKNQLDPDDDPDDKNKDKDKSKDKDKDKDKDKKSVLDPITNFQPPTSVAYLDATGKVIFSRSAIKRSVAPEGSELAVSHDGKIWQVWPLPVSAPETAAQYSPQPVDALHGWTSSTTVLASDLQNAYWLSDDRPPQTVAL